jgi:cytochrome c oxidase subunit 4
MSTHTEDLTPRDHQPDDHHSDHKGEEHAHGGAAVYLKTLLALLVLTMITVGAAYIDFGAGNVVIALTIATIKALIVALIFMHLRYEKPVNAVIAGAGFMFLGLFLMFCVIDFDTREPLQPRNLKPVIQSPAPAGASGAAPAAAPGAAEEKK